MAIKKKITKKTPAKKSARRGPPKQAQTARAVVAGRGATGGHVDIGDWDAAATEDEFTGASLAWEDRQLLATAIRFLYTIVDPRFLRRAVRAGYSKQEHHEMWETFDTAAGRQHGLDDLVEMDLEADPERKRLLVEVDEFENLWFPRTEQIIKRFVAEADTARFLGSFFQDLKQQPLGPTVLDSVSTYLNRVEELATSKLPGATVVLSALRGRGVTDAKIAEVRAKIASLRGGGVRLTARDTTEIATAAKQQTDAVKQLRLAWNDWSTTLRPLYDIREQIQLGLTEARRTPSGGGGGGVGNGGTAEPPGAPVDPGGSPGGNPAI